MSDQTRLTRTLDDIPSQALAQLEAMLDGTAWQSGGRLPPEAELAHQFGVSRPVLRKALAHLRDAGRIISRRGSGNFVQPRADAASPVRGFQALSIKTVFDMKRCMRFRQIVECGAAEDAARHAADVGAMEEAHSRMLGVQPGENVFDADFAFHIAVAQATGNAYYTFALATMRNQIKLMVEFTRKLHEQPADEVAPRVVSEHLAVLAAIRDGNPEKARMAMDYHMKQSLFHLLGEEA